MVSRYGYFEQFDEGTARVYRFIELALSWAYGIAAGIVESNVRPPARILDVGSGTGRLAEVLSRRGYYVVGIDVSLPMVRRAVRFWRPDFVNAGSWHIPIRPSSFDAATALFTMHHWGSHELSLRSIHSLLKEGSVLVVVEADGDRLGPVVGGHSCTAKCLAEALSPYFNVSIVRKFPLIIAVGRRA